MDWTHVFAELDTFLSDDKVRRDVAEFFEVVGHRLEFDDETVVFPPGTRNQVEERMLVRNPQAHGGGYFLVKSILLRPSENGEGTGCDRLGILKIMYNLEGRYIDEFYSRD